MQQNVTYLEKDSLKSLLMIKVIEKFEIIVILQINIEVANEIPIVFQNGSNYDYHFIIKE